jgi:hypothetical protein
VHRARMTFDPGPGQIWFVPALRAALPPGQSSSSTLPCR